MNGQVRMDCNGDLEVVIQGNSLTPPPGFDPDRVPASEKSNQSKNS